ncbi:MAG: DNA polymerase III subunit chi [Pelagimonas sp.]|jgi:DNA polymerase-3 subunit chi|nr:DNA polymerase III subunit chi [Pelagimonas sp.]
MGAVYFYHLTQRPMVETLPVLLEKSLGAGWRVLVRGRDRDRMDWLDQKLWQGPEEGFLPHGLAGGDHDALQPVLLVWEGGAAANNPTCIMSIDGADLTAEEVQSSERCCILFDGHDPEAVQAARVQWKALTGAGCSAQYWSEESGRWEKKAEA